MTKTRLEFTATTAFTGAAHMAERRTGTGLVIQVQSDCIGQARKLAADIETAADIGAGPMMQQVMRERIHQADLDRRPLACAVFYPG